MKTLIKNIGLIVSGDIERPLVEGDSIAIADGRIVAVGKGLEDQADTVIDAKGSAVIPGLIDSQDRKSTRLNSSHVAISYAVFCLKKQTTPISTAILLDRPLSSHCCLS